MPSTNDQDLSSVPNFTDRPRDEHTAPLIVGNQPIQQDQSDKSSTISKEFTDLCMACRTGDYESAESLLNTYKVQLNQFDEWDYSPLILASLCGHYNIVELLLARGAICDRDTFEGARCIYGALNDKIRDLLISYHVSKSTDKLHPFAAHISSLLNMNGPQKNIQLQAKDVILRLPHVQGALTRDLQIYSLNSFLLAAQSPYLKELLAERKSCIDFTSIDPKFFKSIIDFIYLRTEDIPLTEPGFAQVANQFQLTYLESLAHTMSNESDSKKLAKYRVEANGVFFEDARLKMKQFLESDIINNKIEKLIALDDTESSEDVDADDLDISSFLTNTDMKKLLNSSGFPDIIVYVLDFNNESIDQSSDQYDDCNINPMGHFYPVHKAILSISPYFKTMFETGLEYNKLPMIEIGNKSILHRRALQSINITRFYSTNTSYKVAEAVLAFLYHDHLTDLDLKLMIDLLFVANELLLERLKTLVAVSITSKFSKFTLEEWESLEKLLGYNGFDLIRVSWHVRNQRLEQHFSKMIAYNISEISQDSKSSRKLSELIQESAERIKERQQTDTIELVDDIRYFLSKKYRIGDERFNDTDDMPDLENYMWGGKNENIELYQKAYTFYEKDFEIINSALENLGLEA